MPWAAPASGRYTAIGNASEPLAAFRCGRQGKPDDMTLPHRAPGLPFLIPMALLAAASLAENARAAEACPTGPALTAGTETCAASKTGKTANFSWSIWSNASGGCITPSGNTAAFKATWANPGNFLARDGFQWNETQTYDQYGTLGADYAYARTGTGGGFSYVGIYGWSNMPLIEYYILDDWFGTGSAPTAGGTLKGTFDVDGGTYKIYTHQQVNQPSIHGNTTFMQYFSIRQTARQCGHISITEHFNKWKSLGLELGKMYEAKLLVEVGGGTGSIDYSVGNMTSGPATAILRSKAPAGAFSRAGGIDLGWGKAGVFSLFALDGTPAGSVRRTESEPATLAIGGLATGPYLLRVRGDDGAPASRKLILP